MDNKAEIRDFLASRRARVTPEQAGVPTFGGIRRVPGLRREEVAHLAGVSVDYYNRLERGKATGISPEVLDAVSRALQLDDVEREHLRNLFEAVRPAPIRAPRSRTRQVIRPTIQMVVDAITIPAFVQNSRLEILAANTLGHALYADGTQKLTLPFSMPRFLFLDPRTPEFFGDWARAARNQVALLRAAAGRAPDDTELMALIGELSTRSAQFRELWASHDVLKYREGLKQYHHPAVGDVQFIGESFDLSKDEDLALLIYTYEPNTPTEQAMTLLASWFTPSAEATALHADREIDRAE
ncbi:helix-turn-helix transcriptional regulator [Arthrobacter cavernae]|uniref:Helix-turn-helix domain-containing protein n=1 Tax=Arthrobacter cavernae TaxID=2817681 RepID=A0A939HHB2_9MICC|nr:helix-turn-helix transcriptional regulator [Arthrobacter cavernae]MBO1269254.1 helix-turn-helix domain-containing protein [Arthrobacter cavernae]